MQALLQHLELIDKLEAMAVSLKDFDNLVELFITGPELRHEHEYYLRHLDKLMILLS